MPANLTPDYKRAEEAFRKAKTRDERIAALEQMLAVIPKHKGTDKMQADLRKRLSKLRELEEQSGGKRTDHFAVRREGAGQAVIVGAPNCGKSSLLAALTNASPEIADYPFSTPKPLPGMMPFEDIQIQLIDTPPVTFDRVESFHSNLARPTDLILCMVGLGADDPVAQFSEVRDVFEKIKIRFSVENPEESQFYGMADKKTLLVLNKYDLDEDDILLGEFRASVKTELPVFPVSAKNGTGLEELKHTIFEALNIVRIYSKIPGRPPEMKSPFTLPSGSTVRDVARVVHNEIADRLKYARIWGSEKFDGQMVQRDYVVHDRDIIELHT